MLRAYYKLESDAKDSAPHLTKMVMVLTSQSITIPSFVTQVEMLLIAGGGGGGATGSGGGAGGLIYNSALSVAPNASMAVVIGNGGAGGVQNVTWGGGGGGNSTFAGLTANGGGGGVTHGSSSGIAGGSGSGGAVTTTATPSGGSGVSGQGFAGGNGYLDSGWNGWSGGGGGAGAVGKNGGNVATSGNGGIGKRYFNTYWAGGGGGGEVNASYTATNAGVGGLGGGGGGLANSAGRKGVANTGGGGGGGSYDNAIYMNGGDGGSGIFILKYVVPEEYKYLVGYDATESGTIYNNIELVRYFLFNNNTNDSSPYAINGTPTAITYGLGPLPNTSCAIFNGTTSGISVPSFNRILGQELSVSCWFYQTSRTGYQDLVSNRDSIVGHNWMLYTHTTDGSLQLHGSAQNKSSYVPPLNTWVHVTATVDSTGLYTLYANGSIVQQILGYTYNALYPITLTIGNFSTQFFSGRIALVRIFDRALNVTEVNNLLTDSFISTDKACMFNRTNYIQLPNEVLPLGQELSISFWASGGNDLGTFYNSVIAANNTTDSSRMLNLHFPWTDMNIFFDVGWDYGTYDRIYKVSVARDTKCPYKHYCLTRNNSGEMRIYINGEVWHSGSGKTVAINPTNRFTIGGEGGPSWQGKLKELRIYDHALTPSDVSLLASTFNLSNYQSQLMDKQLIFHHKYNDFKGAVSNMHTGVIPGIYNNYVIPAVLFTTGETFKNEPVYRLMMYPNTQAIVDNFNASTGNHGVTLDAKQYVAYTQYRCTIYYRQMSHVTYVDGQPSNIGGWTVGTYETDGKWTRAVSVRDGTFSSTATDGKYWGIQTTGMTLGEIVTVDFCCPQTEQNNIVTPYVNGYREDRVIDYTTNSSSLLELIYTPNYVTDSKIGSGCYQFDGVSQRISTSFLQSNLGQEFTISAWLYPTADSNYLGAIGDHNGTYYGISFCQYESGLRYCTYGSGSTWTASAGFTLPLNTWTHVVWNLQTGPDGYSKVYLNGTLNSTVSATEPLLPLGSIIIGRSYNSAGRYWQGKIDDVRIYTKSLTQSEITEMQNPPVLQIDDSNNIHTNDLIVKEQPGLSVFYSSGTFIVPESITSVDVLIVAGGGGGGMDMGGGGGGGGVIYQRGVSVTPNASMSVVVGDGGRGAPAGSSLGNPAGHQFIHSARNGGNSSFGGLTAIGGGAGGSSVWTYTPGWLGSSGGSGGGASGYNSTAGQGGGAGTSGQGYRGGNAGGYHYSGGGGGAGGAGADGTAVPHGGIGVLSDILGIPFYFGGGGGGSAHSTSPGGNGGSGGGGGGAVGTTYGGSGINNGQAGGGGSPNAQTNTPGGNAGMNTGGGGGGGSHYNLTNKGGEGGSGIVVIRYNPNIKVELNGLKKTVSIPTSASISNLVGYWPMLSNFNDYSGLKNHGVVSTTTGPIDFGYSFRGIPTASCDGVATKYVRIKFPYVTSDWSIAVWVMKMAHNPASYPIFYSCGLPYLACSGETSPFRFSFVNASTGQDNISSTTIPELNKFYHVTVTKTVSRLQIFINGILENTYAVVCSSQLTTFDLFRHYSDDNYRVAGALSDLRIYGKVLDQSEVNKLYTESRLMKSFNQI